MRFSLGSVERGRTWTEPAHEPHVLLLHRRLSILDTTESGWQPMSTPDGRYHIVFNGEIYNFVELRDELAAQGHRFSSRSDTEVLLAAYAQWGRDALCRLTGMFAFALLDVQRGTVLLARDFFGIKPLFYSVEDGMIRFGSEIKALFAFGLTSREANAERLLYFLRYGIADFGDETMFSAVRQLPPAHYMEITIQSATASEPVCFWQPDSGGELDLSFDEAAQELKRLFLRSVELHLRSDVPLGTALSGGIDSSAIIAAVRHLNSDAEIHAFSFVSDEEQTSEEQWIDIVAAAVRAEVHKVRIGSRAFLDCIETLSGVHDEPFARTSTYAQYEIFRAASDAGVKVMLDGQGADEILAGYNMYIGARLASLVRGGEWSDAARLMRGFPHSSSLSRIQGIAFCADYLLPPSLQGPARKMLAKAAFPPWLNRQWFTNRTADIVVTNYTPYATNILKHSLARSVRQGLPGLLRYEDRNSMASSVESRVPFLTPDLVNFLGRLPEKFLISPDGTTKAVFRKAMRGIVPDAILDRRDKIGFATPERLWLTELDAWVNSALNSESARRLPFLNLPEARKEWVAIRDRKKPFDFRIGRWLSLICWTEQFQVTYGG
jgi:asparagine synthase (glutamine-hydrolysing)